MAIPDYQVVMLPLLASLQDGKEHKLEEATDAIVTHFRLNDEERTRRLPSGRSTYIRNRTGWARTYMKNAGLIESPRRGFMKITRRGLDVLEQNPARIDKTFLEQFPEFLAFLQKAKAEKPKATGAGANESQGTPEEVMDVAYAELRETLETELLDQVMQASPEFFEGLVVELLVAMGYGGSQIDAGRTVGQSGDGGVDGVIKEDSLGLDSIYIQAKRWANTVGRPEIQKFAGALQGVRARKGVFITTSNFSKEATQYADAIESSIVLVDGPKLAELMADHGLGVSTQRVYEIRRIDSDYFLEE